MSQLHDRDAEESLLSNWVFNERFRKAWVPEPEIFQVTATRVVAEVARDLHGGPVTDATVLVELEKRGLLDKAGGLQAVSDMLVNKPTVPNPHKLVERLRERVALATFVGELRRAVATAETGGGLDGAKRAVSAALRAAVVWKGSEVVTVRNALSDAVKRLGKHRPQDGIRYRSGVRGLDWATGGHRKGHIWIIGGETNWGKSSFVISDANQIMAQGGKVLICSNEDDWSIYANRLLALRANVDAMKLRDNLELDAAEYARIAEVLAAAKPDPFYLDIKGMTGDEIGGAIESLCATQHIDVVYVDYIQKVRVTPGVNRREALMDARDRISDAIKNNTGAGGVILTQLTDCPRGTRPTRDNIRDCKDLGHGAEVLAFGYFANSDPQSNDRNKRQLFIDKVKDGPKCFDIDLAWNNRTASFMTDTYEPEEHHDWEPDGDFFEDLN